MTAVRVRVREGPREWVASVDGASVAFDGVDAAVTVRAGADGRVDTEGPAGPAAGVAATRGDIVWVALGGWVFEFHTAPDEGGAAAATRDHDAFMPPMSATVVRVQAAPGDRVADGDVLIVLEAMKMELPLRAPRDGTVRAVHCREGDLVHPGTVLLDLD